MEKGIKKSPISLNEKERAVDQKIKSADEKIKQLDKLKSQIDSVRLDIKQKSEQLDKTKVLAEQIYADRQVLDQRKSSLDLRENSIIASEKQLQEKDNSFKIKESQLNETESKLKNKDLSLTDKESQLTAKEVQFKEKETKLSEKEQQLTQKESQLKDTESKLTTQDLQVKAKEAKLNSDYKGLEDDEFKKYMEEILKDIGDTSSSKSFSSSAEESVNSELVTYIKKHLKKGFKQERIINALQGAGWSEDEVKLAINFAMQETNLGSSNLKELPPVVGESQGADTQLKLQQITSLLAQARTLVRQKSIPDAQNTLIQAKYVYDSLYLDEHKKEMLKYEIQDIKAEIDLALLS